MIKDKVKKYSFSSSIKFLIEGKKIQRIGWNNKNYKCYFILDALCIEKPEGTTHNWILNKEDLKAQDWIIVK